MSGEASRKPPAAPQDAAAGGIETPESQPRTPTEGPAASAPPEKPKSPRKRRPPFVL